jgi:hypothetical protein
MVRRHPLSAGMLTRSLGHGRPMVRAVLEAMTWRWMTSRAAYGALRCTGLPRRHPTGASNASRTIVAPFHSCLEHDDYVILYFSAMLKVVFHFESCVRSRLSHLLAPDSQPESEKLC